MSLELSHPDDSPSIITATRDGVSDPSATFDSSGPGDAQLDPSPISSGPGTKKRRSSKIAKAVRRSLSIPHVRGTTMSESDDKKRNKLGYQRISIACAHCRRRKIRCLVAEGDPHGRCQNCIRLKKECVYFPVDQQGVVESKSQSSSGQTGIATGPSSAVSSSTPPDVDAGRALDDQHDFRGFQTLPSNAPNSYPGFAVDHSSTLPHPNDPSQAADFGGRVFDPTAGGMIQAGPDYRSQASTHSPWLGAGGFNYPPSGMASQSPVYSSPQYWRSQTTASASDYASFPYDATTSSSAPQSAHPYVFSQQRHDQMWAQQQQQQQQPVRSFSYGQAEGYGQPTEQYGGFHPEGMRDPHFARHGPPSLDLQSASMMAQTHAHGPHSAPMRHPHQTFIDPSHPYAMQPPQYHPNGMPAVTVPGYPSALYQDSPQLIQEEQASPASESYAVHPHQPG